MSLVSTAAEQKIIAVLLARGTPHYRLAYSDRTAWLMATLAELAYLPFHAAPVENRQSSVPEISKLADNADKNPLMTLVNDITADADGERQLLERELDYINGKLLATFDRGGTQAMLVKLDLGVVLVFRGTETNRFTDIKADLNAVSIRYPGGGRLHRGFEQAYALVAEDIKAALSGYRNLPLLVTGHSLGGALASVAVRHLEHEVRIAACYTFGSPRVGDAVWISSIKTPIYRLVNAADAVPLLPPGGDALTVLGWSARLIPWAGKSVQRWLLNTFGGYIHGGFMRYLTNCPPGEYQRVRLLYTVSLFYRFKAVAFNKMPWKRFLSDHSIETYRKKLAVVALRRNPEGEPTDKAESQETSVPVSGSGETEKV